MTNKKIQLTTNVDGQSVNVYPVTKSEFVEFPDGKTLDEKIDSASTEHKHDLATPAKDGFMSKEDKAKLDGVTNYTHPNTHAATMITEDNDHRFVTDAEKNKWNNKVDAVLATNASNGLMSASDKQKIDDLNNQFKNRDDKIEKNKQDVKSLNDEVIEKEYSYFNNQSTILNTISGKTKDMIIKGKTFHNIFPTDTSKLVAKNVEVLDSIYTITPRTDQYSNIWDVKNMLYKPNTEYTVVIDILENRLIKKDNVANNLCFFMCGYENTESVFGNNGLQKVLSDKTSERIVKKIRTIEDFSVLSNNFGARFFLNNVFTGGTLKLRIKVLEGDWTENLIPENIEGLQNFGDKIEENKYKINSIAIGKNLFNKNQFSQYFNGKGELVFKQTGNTRMNNHFVIHSSKDPFAIQVLNANYSPNSRTFKTINQEKYYILMGLNGDKRDNKVWGEILLPRNTICTFSSINNSGDNTWVSFKDIQIEIGNSKTKYQDYKANKTNIYMKDDLKQINADIFDYINYDLNICRNIKRHIFTEKDAWLQGSCNNSTHIGFYVLWNTIGGKINGKCRCNNFRLISLSEYNDANVEGYLSDIGFNVKIAKNRLPSGTMEGFKEWLKTNPIEVLFEAENPIVEKCDCLDTNLYTYSENTFITCDNDIKGDMSFIVPMNLGASFENNSERIDLIEDTLKDNNNNKSRIEKLEEGAVTSSLNIIDLQKDIKNNNDYTHYSGNNISIVNSKESRTSNMIIKGRTSQNLWGKAVAFVKAYQHYFDIEKINNGWKLIKGSTEIRGYYNVIPNHMLRSNTTYTLILKKGIGNITYEISGSFTDDYFTSIVTKNNVIQFTTKNSTNEIYVYVSSEDETITIYDEMLLLEGNWNNEDIPDFFEGLNSSGEEEHKINILSQGKNLFNKEEDLSNWWCEENKVFKTHDSKNYSVIIKALPNTQYIKSVDTSIAPYVFLDKDDNVLEYGNSKITKIAPPNTKKLLWYLEPGGISEELSNKIQIEKGNVPSEYKNFKTYKKEFLLQEPLYEGNYLYEENRKVKLYKKIKKYVFTGDEDFIKVNDYGDVIRFDYACKDIKSAGKIICNLFLKGSITTKNLECINIHGESKYIQFQIKKSKLSSESIEGFKQWLKNNQVIILYELEKPEIKIIDNINDLNIEVFNDYTNISFLNSVPGILEFNIPNNLATQIKENTSNINKSINSLEMNYNKISELENAQMTTALNVLELQKHTAMLNNGKVDDYTNYSGTFIKYNNGLDSRTENMTIKGKTLVNLVKHRLTNQKVGGSSSWSAGLGTNEMFKINTPYTIVYTINSIENGTKKTTLNFSGGMDIPDILLESSNNVGTHKETFVLKNQPSRTHTNVSLYHLNDNSTVKSFSDVMIFEGEIDFIPKYFEGIKSFGEEEKVGDKYKINIISHSKNLLPDSEKTVFKEGHNCEFIQYGDLAPIFDKYGLKDYTISFDLKSKDISKHNTMQVYCQNGETAKYDIGLNIINVTTEFKRYSIIVRPNLAYPNDKKSYLAFYGNYETGNAPVVKNVKVEEGKVESPLYEPYIEDKRDVLINEPLYKGNYIIEENNNINLYKRYDKYIFNGNENWILGTSGGGWGEYEDTLVFYVASFEQAHVNSSFLCDKFIFLNVVNNNVIGIYNAVWGSAPHPAIRIKKTELETKDVEGFKKWLKNNPVTIIYEIKDPITKAINCTDINVDTYKDITYVNTSNSIKGELEFKTQNNFGAIMKNVNRCISKIFNSLNNILNIKGE